MREATFLPYPLKKETLQQRESFLQKLDDLPSLVNYLPAFIEDLAAESSRFIRHDLGLRNQSEAKIAAYSVEPAVRILNIAVRTLQVYGVNLEREYDFISISGPLLRNLYTEDHPVPLFSNDALIASGVRAKRNLFRRQRIVGVERDWIIRSEILEQYFADLVSFSTIVATEGDIPEDALVEVKTGDKDNPFISDQAKREAIKRQSDQIVSFCWNIIRPNLKIALQEPRLVRVLNPARWKWENLHGQETTFAGELERIFLGSAGEEILHKNPKTGEVDRYLWLDLIDSAQDALEFWNRRFEVEGMEGVQEQIL